jgi:hypothetical protein
MAGAIALVGCAHPGGAGLSGAPASVPAGPGTATGVSGYHTQQLDPIDRRARPFPHFFRYRPEIEQALIGMVNGGQRRGGRRSLYVYTSIRDAARAQNVRMAARGTASITQGDLAQLTAAVSPVSETRDYWVFVNRVSAPDDASAADALVTGGSRPMNAYNFYALKANFTGVGAGVYRYAGVYYGTVVVFEAVSGLSAR